jgi:hypothetical protein
MITEFYRKDQNNPGDWFSNPSRYFFQNKNLLSIDIDNVKKTVWDPSFPIIVGGGGLIGNDNFESLMDRIILHPDERILKDTISFQDIKNISNKNKELIWKWREEVQKITVKLFEKIDKTLGPRVIWGAGHNSKDIDIDSSNIDWPEYMLNFHLVGVRDWDTGYRWVPCASCMHSAFDKEYKITNEVVWFEHKKRLIDNKVFDKFPTPRMLNTGQNLEQIIEFLGSAETVVTNSYHGVYWATLLKRKVVCIPWGSKFNMFKHIPTIANEKNWESLISKATAYNDALKDCREANQNFYNDVIKLFEEK